MATHADRILNVAVKVSLPWDLAAIADKVAHRNRDELTAVWIWAKRPVPADPDLVRRVKAREEPRERPDVVATALYRWLLAGAKPIDTDGLPRPPGKRSHVTVWWDHDVFHQWDAKMRELKPIFQQRGRHPAPDKTPSLDYKWASVIVARYLSKALGREVPTDAIHHDFDAPCRIPWPEDGLPEMRVKHGRY